MFAPAVEDGTEEAEAASRHPLRAPFRQGHRHRLAVVLVAYSSPSWASVYSCSSPLQQPLLPAQLYLPLPLLGLPCEREQGSHRHQSHRLSHLLNHRSQCCLTILSHHPSL